MPDVHSGELSFIASLGSRDVGLPDNIRLVFNLFNRDFSLVRIDLPISGDFVES